MKASLFVEFFGDTPFIRVVDFLIENAIFDYTKTEIAENAGISRASLYKAWAALELYGIVKQSRQIGNATLYKLNRENVLVKKLVELDLKISKEYAETLTNKQKITARN